MVFDLSSEDLGSGLVGELHNDWHGLHKHPGLEGFLVDNLSVIFHAFLFELLANISVNLTVSITHIKYIKDNYQINEDHEKSAANRFSHIGHRKVIF